MANENRYYKTPFAESGNKTEVPDVSVGGAVGYDTGFGPDYELPQGSVNRKRIERDLYNGMHNGITKNLKQWQENLYPTWIEDNGEGVAYSYSKGMIVSLNDVNYVSLEDANQEEPGAGSKWGLNDDVLINDLSQAYNFADVAEYKAFTKAFPEGKRVYLADRCAYFTVIAGTGTANTFNVIASDETGQSITLEEDEQTNINHYGADVTGATEVSTVAQFFVDTNSFLRVGEGDYLFAAPVAFTENKKFIKGVFGKSKIIVDGDFGALTTSGEIVSEVLECSGITFSSTNRGEGSGIHTPRANYLSHWNIHHCIFERRLAYGIQANPVGCVINDNIFGFNTPNVADNFKPLELLGEVDDAAGTPLLPNANVIKNNWIIRSSNTVDSAIDIMSGVQNIITENLIESCEGTVATIRLRGDSYAKIHHNYFEKPQAPAVVKVENSTGGVVDTVFLEFEHNHLLINNAITSWIIDFNGAEQDKHTFIGNIIPFTQGTMNGLVQDKDGGADTFQGCYQSYGNFVTGAISGTPYDGIDNFNVSTEMTAYSSEDFAQLGCKNSTGGLSRFGWRNTALVNMARVPPGVEVDIDIGGGTPAKFDSNTTNGNSRFFLYDNVTGVLQRVKIGVNSSQSGGRGLYINNS